MVWVVRSKNEILHEKNENFKIDQEFIRKFPRAHKTRWKLHFYKIWASELHYGERRVLRTIPCLCRWQGATSLDFSLCSLRVIRGRLWASLKTGFKREVGDFNTRKHWDLKILTLLFARIIFQVQNEKIIWFDISKP